MHCEKLNANISRAYCELCQATAVWASSELRKGYPECLRVPDYALDRIQKCGQCEYLSENSAPHIITQEEWKQISQPIMEMTLDIIFRPTREYVHERHLQYDREYKQNHKGGEKIG